MEALTEKLVDSCEKLSDFSTDSMLNRSECYKELESELKTLENKKFEKKLFGKTRQENIKEFTNKYIEKIEQLIGEKKLIMDLMNNLIKDLKNYIPISKPKVPEGTPSLISNPTMQSYSYLSEQQSEPTSDEINEISILKKELEDLKITLEQKDALLEEKDKEIEIAIDEAAKATETPEDIRIDYLVGLTEEHYKAISTGERSQIKSQIYNLLNKENSRLTVYIANNPTKYISKLSNKIQIEMDETSLDFFTKLTENIFTDMGGDERKRVKTQIFNLMKKEGSELKTYVEENPGEYIAKLAQQVIEEMNEVKENFTSFNPKYFQNLKRIRIVGYPSIENKFNKLLERSIKLILDFDSLIVELLDEIRNIHYESETDDYNKLKKFYKKIDESRHSISDLNDQINYTSKKLSNYNDRLQREQKMNKVLITSFIILFIIISALMVYYFRY